MKSLGYIIFVMVVISVSCKKEEETPPRLPIITTLDVKDIKDSYAVVSAEIEELYGKDIISKGICYVDHTNPDISDFVVYDNGEEDVFEVALTGMTGEKTYYARAFVETADGIGYGTNVIFVTSKEYHLGNPGPAGGVVFHKKDEYSDGWKYLEIANEPLVNANGYKWGCSGDLLGANAAELGQGNYNTTKIVNNCIESSAARVAKNATFGGYGQWYLPSKEEIVTLFLNLSPTHVNGLGSHIYWTSSEKTYQYAYAFDINSESVYAEVKTKQYKVCAVRYF